MSENLLLGKGNPVSKHLKKCISIKYRELKNNKNNNNNNNNNILAELQTTFNISEATATRYGPIDPTLQLSPKKKGRKIKVKLFDVNDYIIIDQIICDFYDLKSVSPCFSDIYRKVNSDPDCDLSFKGVSFRYFLKILDKMGYKKVNSKKVIRSHIIDSNRIQKLIINYLTQKTKLPKIYQGYEFVYIDECGYHENDLNSKILLPHDPNKKINVNKSIGPGERFTVIHAISESGFVENALEIVKHDTINATIFEEWAANKLIPNLKSKSIVVFDNATPHTRTFNRQPVKTSTKAFIIEWLRENNIPFDSSAKRTELYLLAKQNRVRTQYHFDRMLIESGHVPLRLPPFMCDLNPIEKTWAHSKDYVRKHNVNRPKSEFKKLIKESFSQITSSQVCNTIRHVIKDVESQLLVKFNVIKVPVINEHNYSVDFLPTNIDLNDLNEI